MTAKKRRLPQGEAALKSSATTTSHILQPQVAATVPKTARLSWPTILTHAAEIVESYDTGVTLRQLFYRLVVGQTLPNTKSYYQRLSACTAQGRRDGTFPNLLDKQSHIERYKSFTGPDEATAWLRDLYRRDRTEGQPWTIFLGVEKAGQSEQLDAWFTEPLGIPHVALGGYASQSLVDHVRRDVRSQDRPAVLIYAGDHDPTGEDIDRDFESRTGCFDKVVRVALHADQLDEFNIPPNALDPKVEQKLANDPRAAAFRNRHGYLDQYEMDALDANDLRDLYRNAIDDYFDASAYESVMAAEASDLEAWSS